MQIIYQVYFSTLSTASKLKARINADRSPFLRYHYVVVVLIISGVVLFLLFVFCCLVFEFVLLNDAVDCVINWQVLQLGCVGGFVEDEFKVVVLCVWDLVSLLWGHWRWWEDRVHRNSKYTLLVRECYLL
jgi:hypothetical protein